MEIRAFLQRADKESWAIAYPDGLGIFLPGNAPGHLWIPRNGSDSADDTLAEHGYTRVTEWQSDKMGTWSAFVDKFTSS